MPLPTELDTYIRYQTGVRGYLEYQDQLNRALYETFAEVFRPAEAELDLFFANLLEAGKFATAAEVKTRENQRLATLGRLPEDTAFSGSAVPFNQEAITAAERALTIFRGASEQLQDKRSAFGQLRTAFPEEGARAAIEEGRESFTQSIVKFNIGSEELGEVSAIWDEVIGRASDPDALAAFVDENLEGFISRRGEPDRGIEPHSPLPWWKWQLIATILAAAVFAIILCFVYFGCTWVWLALILVAPWVFGIINRGC
jgi:hypothetical protein